MKGIRASEVLGLWALRRLDIVRKPSAMIPVERRRAVFRERPEGRLHYDASGRMFVLGGNLGRPTWEADSVGEGSAEEYARAATEFIAYYGTYRVDEETSRIVHVIENSLFPNYIGKDLVRVASLDGAMLTLLTLPRRVQGEDEIVEAIWERMP